MVLYLKFLKNKLIDYNYFFFFSWNHSWNYSYQDILKYLFNTVVKVNCADIPNRSFEPIEGRRHVLCTWCSFLGISLSGNLKYCFDLCKCTSIDTKEIHAIGKNPSRNQRWVNYIQMFFIHCVTLISFTPLALP